MRSSSTNFALAGDAIQVADQQNAQQSFDQLTVRSYPSAFTHKRKADVFLDRRSNGSQKPDLPQPLCRTTLETVLLPIMIGKCLPQIRNQQSMGEMLP